MTTKVSNIARNLALLIRAKFWLPSSNSIYLSWQARQIGPVCVSILTLHSTPIDLQQWSAFKWTPVWLPHPRSLHFITFYYWVRNCRCYALLGSATSFIWQNEPARCDWSLRFICWWQDSHLLLLVEQVSAGTEWLPLCVDGRSPCGTMRWLTHFNF